MLPPPRQQQRRRPPSFDDAAARFGFVVCVVLIVVGALLVTLASGGPEAIGASFLTLGGLGLGSQGFVWYIEYRRLNRPIPLDPDTMRVDPERRRRRPPEGPPS
jgi:hypothetical protein